MRIACQNYKQLIINRICKLKKVLVSFCGIMTPLGSICFLFILASVNLNGQSAEKNFHQLSHAEKNWVLFHPFIAKKAFHCTERARFVTDSLRINGILKDGNGGQLDAFRHAYWMALLTQKISPRKAEHLGEVHEKGNYQDWKKGKEEDSLRADSMMCVMDLKNNSSGIEIGKKFSNDTSIAKIPLESLVLKELRAGKLVMIKKNAAGQFLDESGRLIVLEQYNQKWFIPKVLVRTDYTQPRNN
jgi:hypothetical protein